MGGLSKVIVLDPDARAGRQVQLGFAREGVPAAAVPVNGGRPEIPADGGLVIVGGSDAALIRAAREVLAAQGQDVPVVFAGRGVARTEAEAAGADEIVAMPAFLRDVVTIGKLLHGRPAGEREHLVGSLAETTGVFTLVRALAALGRSAVLTLIRGLRRGEIRFFHGEVTSAQVGLIHGQAAFHQLLLWTEARFELTREDIVRRHQIPLTPEELFADAERFLEGVRDESGKLSPSMVLEQDMARIGALGKQIPTEVHGVLRMFDGHRVLADILEDSPYRVFETLRVAQRACDVGLLRIVTNQRPKATWRAVLSIEEWLVGSADKEAAIERAQAATVETGPAPKSKPRKGGKRKKRTSTGQVAAGSKAEIDWGALVPRVVGGEVGGLSGVVPAAQRSGEISLPPSRSVEREKLESLMDTQQRERVFAKDIGVEPTVVLDEAVVAAKQEVARAAQAAKVEEEKAAAEATAVAEARAAVEGAEAAKAAKRARKASPAPAASPSPSPSKAPAELPSIIVEDSPTPTPTNSPPAPAMIEAAAATRIPKPTPAPKLVEAAAATRIPKPTPAPVPLPGMPPPKTDIAKVIADKAAAEQAKADAKPDEKADAPAASAPDKPAFLNTPPPISSAAEEPSPAERAAAKASEQDDAAAEANVAADKLAAEKAVAEARAAEEARAAREAAERKAAEEDARLRAEAAEWAKQQAAARARAAEQDAREAEELARRVAEAKAKAEAEAQAGSKAHAHAGSGLDIAAPDIAASGIAAPGIAASGLAAPDIAAPGIAAPDAKPDIAAAAPATAEADGDEEAMWRAAKQRAEEAERAEQAAAARAIASSVSGTPAAPSTLRTPPPVSPAALAVAAAERREVVTPGVVTAESGAATVVVHDHMTIDATANTARVTSQSLAAITSAAPEAFDDEPSDGVVRQFTTVETAPLRPPPPPVPPDDRPDDTMGEISSRPKRPSGQLPPVVSGPSILVADLAAAQAAIAAVAPKQAAAPATPNAAAPAREQAVAEVRKDAVAFSDDEEEFFRAGVGNTGKVPQFAPESFDDLDEDYRPVGFWDRLRGKKPPPK